MKHFIAGVRASFGVLACMTLLLGLAYPMVITGLAQAFFSWHANGSLIERGDKILGSTLLGQEFTQKKYFWGRLSASNPPYDPLASGGTNFSPASTKLMDAANARIAALQKTDPANHEPVPIELITASGSGLDPHLSRKAIDYQVPRIAGARNMHIEDVEALVARMTEKPLFGLAGEPYVNVLKLNLALDEKKK
jgi:K+-transporting ATPase ATPase C chain